MVAMYTEPSKSYCKARTLFVCVFVLLCLFVLFGPWSIDSIAKQVRSFTDLLALQIGLREFDLQNTDIYEDSKQKWAENKTDSRLPSGSSSVVIGGGPAQEEEECCFST